MSFPYTYKNKLNLLGDKIKDIKPDAFFIKSLIKEELKKRTLNIIDDSATSVKYEAYSEIFKYDYTVEIISKEKNNEEGCDGGSFGYLPLYLLFLSFHHPNENGYVGNGIHDGKKTSKYCQ